MQFPYPRCLQLCWGKEVGEGRGVGWGGGWGGCLAAARTHPRLAAGLSAPGPVEVAGKAAPGRARGGRGGRSRQPPREPDPARPRRGASDVLGPERRRATGGRGRVPRQDPRPGRSWRPPRSTLCEVGTAPMSASENRDISGIRTQAPRAAAHPRRGLHGHRWLP